MKNLTFEPLLCLTFHGLEEAKIRLFRAICTNRLYAMRNIAHGRIERYFIFIEVKVHRLLNFSPA